MSARPLHSLAQMASSLLLGLALLLTGCDDEKVSYGFETDTGDGKPGHEVSDNGSGRPGTLLERMAAAPEAVAFRGVRRVRLVQREEDRTDELVYREEIVSDGQGGFALRPLELLHPRLPLDQAEQFRLLQEVRAGFVHRFRDFAVRDPRAFLRNWTVRAPGEQEEVAGRAGEVLHVEREGVPGASYRVVVDAPTGLVLAFVERDRSGARVLEVTYEALELDPDLAGVALRPSRLETQELDPRAPLEAQAGFELFAPELPPSGYELAGADAVTDEEGRRWLRLRYGDGVESVLYMQSEPSELSDSNSDAGEGATPPAGALPANPSTPADAIDAVVAPAEGVRLFRLGPWTVVDGHLHGARVLAMGKVPEEQLLQMLQSTY